MSGGFRWPWLARVTKGRLGLGRWTQEEVDGINERARQRFEALIEASSLGTPSAKAARASVPDEVVARIMARVKELEDES